MNRIFATFGISLWIALLSPMVQAANLKALDVAALPGDRVELKLTFDEQGISIPFPQMDVHIKKDKQE
mgnify:CR=1 FL=1